MDCQHDLGLGTEQEHSNGHQYIIIQQTRTTPWQTSSTQGVANSQ